MKDQPPAVPAYDELPRNDVLDGRVSWGVFGEDDEIGAVNLLTPDRIVRAAAEIRSGTFYNMSLPLDQPEPPRSLPRSRYRHQIFALDRNVQDDVLDNFYPQASSQLDGLRHVAAREFGFYNGIAAPEAGPNGTKLGIERWAEHGVVGRAVVVDLAEAWARSGVEFSLDGRLVVGPDLLDEALTAQRARLEPGDVLLLRTGYLRAYDALTTAERRDLPRTWPGLSASEAMARYLWDHGVAFVGADNPAVEARPGDAGYLHRRLIPMLGIGLAEMLMLDRLTDDCAVDGRWTCFFAAVPLNLPGGVGSPANAFALR